MTRIGSAILSGIILIGLAAAGPVGETPAGKTKDRFTARQRAYWAFQPVRPPARRR